MPRGKHNGHRRGSAHPRWNDQRILSSHGYVKVRVGREHRLADPNGYAYEHLLVWVAAGNPRPALGELLHHRNEEKTDNRLANLELITIAEHQVRHTRQRDEAGRFTKSGGRLLDGRTWDEMPERVEAP